MSSTLQAKLKEKPVDFGHPGSGKLHRTYRERLSHTSIYQTLALFWRYLATAYQGRQNHNLFEQVKTYCLFIGHARSGHSIVGALLDAHPNAVIADEVDTLHYLAAGFNRDQLFSLLLSASYQLEVKKGRKKQGREGKTYSYSVPGQWQGRFDKLDVIGDTRAGGSTIRIGSDPGILTRLRATMPDISLKVLQVIRNPYDNISTKMIRRGMSFEDSIGDYFRNCEITSEICNLIDQDEFLLIRQEDVILQPEQTITQMCHFLGLDPKPDYLSACASILYKSPSNSRDKLDWAPELIDFVQGKIDQFDFLAGYTYEN